MSLRRARAILCTLTVLLAGLPGTGSAGNKKRFRIHKVIPQRGWATTQMPPGSWKPVDQPNLQAELDNAPGLQLKNLAISAGTVKVKNAFLIPNPDGKSWDAIIPYREGYGGSGELFIYDFGSKKLNHFSWGKAEADNIYGKPTDFHMQPCFFTKGKAVFLTWTKPKYQVVFWLYDPAVNKFVHTSQPFGMDFTVGADCLGDDGKIYSIGHPADRSGFRAFRFDPETCKVKLYGKFGTCPPKLTLNYRKAVSSGDWIYAKYGHSPWKLLAFNIKSGKGYELAASNVRGDWATISLEKMVGGVQGSIRHASFVKGISNYSKKQFDFWLQNGRIVPRTSKIPPWSNEPVKKAGKYMFKRYAGRFREHQHWGEEATYTVAPPASKLSDYTPIDAEGNVAIPYKLDGQSKPEVVKFKVKLYPSKIQYIREVSDEVLFLSAPEYGDHIFYNAKTKASTRVLAYQVSTYGIGASGDKLYVSGYPNMLTLEYDLKKDLSNLRAGANPKILGHLGSKCDTHSTIGGVAKGADGCIYAAGVTYGRRRDGGGLAWYNPETGEAGGINIDGPRPFWMSSASKGRYIILSTKNGDHGKLFCWDTKTKKFIYEKASPRGPIAEAFPGMIIGHGYEHDTKSSVLYGFEAATGKVLWKKPVPVNPVASFSNARKHKYTFRRGPDGFIWATFGRCLVRINPVNAKVLPVGNCVKAQISFANNAVYVADGTYLRKVVGLKVKSLTSGKR